MVSFADLDRIREMDAVWAQYGYWPYWQVERHGTSPTNLGGLESATVQNSMPAEDQRRMRIEKNSQTGRIDMYFVDGNGKQI